MREEAESRVVVGGGGKRKGLLLVIERSRLY